VLLGASGPVDFHAIAAAQDELAHSRGLREEAGIDVLRDTGEDVDETASVASAATSQQHAHLASSRLSDARARGGGGGGGAGVEAMPRSRGASISLASMPPPPAPAGDAPAPDDGAPGAAAAAAHLYRPALEASRAQSLHAATVRAPRPPYDAAAVTAAAAAGLTPTLMDMLLPTEAWAAASAGGRLSLGALGVRASPA